jgi:hypothetical protein
MIPRISSPTSTSSTAGDADRAIPAAAAAAAAAHLASPIIVRVKQAKSTAITREGLAQGHGKCAPALLSNLTTAIENVDGHFALYQSPFSTLND